ncbi:DUF4136 domain-containing protein [Shewanella sp. Isolate11]|uniref:DUF4136 domain-containing protein n=1 Tax=Shewanella sp. Isolate11 TaxID=2908530 RepID=UPI001EFE07DC|nr:DUF4136 domain-containing protein [Shewanella sp. Isolate11]MCG9696901.1 DUF4136 domain-containing protein [Shewanella sp. Isolate11]
MVKPSAILLPLLLLTACVTEPQSKQKSQVQTERIMTVASGDISFISSDNQRFALHPNFSKLAVDNTVDSNALMHRMQQAIIDTMMTKGYQHVHPQDMPDFLIGFGVAFESQLSDAQILQDTGMVAGLSEQGVDMSEYEKSSVLLMLFAANEVRPRWKVLAQGFTDLEQHLDESSERLHHLMHNMLAALPNRD